MFQVAREFSMEVRASGIYLLDFVLVEPGAIEPTDTQIKTQHHDQDNCSNSMTFKR